MREKILIRWGHEPQYKTTWRCGVLIVFTPREWGIGCSMVKSPTRVCRDYRVEFRVGPIISDISLWLDAPDTEAVRDGVKNRRYCH